MDEPVGSDIRALQSDDGHRWELIARLPSRPHAALLWLPALGVTARHYLPFAEALAARGIAVFVHEWRGSGSSSLRASRDNDWGYRELLTQDLPRSEAAIGERLPGTELILGGHSLGGQLACCRLAIVPQVAKRLWLVASGAPYWRAFPPPSRYWLPLVYRFLPWLADRRGVLPGRRLGFAGQEARGVIRDWARTAISGSYAAAGLVLDSGTIDARARQGLPPALARPGWDDRAKGELDDALRRVDVEVRAVLLRDDWLVPRSSLDYLLSRLAKPHARVAVLDAPTMGTRADHFAWMKQPRHVVDHLVD